MLRALNLLYTQISKGKYSLEYYNKFNTVYKFLPYKNPLKSHFIPHNMFMFEKMNGCPNFTTEISISFHDIPFLSTMDSLKKYYGNPVQYCVESINGHLVAIAAYNTILPNDKNKTVLYFFDNELVEIERVFSNITDKKYRDTLIHSLHKKYIDTSELPENDTICIQDKNKNTVFAHWNGFDFTIKYLSAFGSIYRETIIDYYNNGWKSVNKKQVQESEHSYDLQEVFL